jgi:predicted RNA-binding protein with PIN domain
MTDEKNWGEQMGLMGALLPLPLSPLPPLLPLDEGDGSRLERIRSRLTPQEKKIFVAMSDLAKQHKQISVDPAFAKKMFVAMATRTYRVQVKADGRVSVSSWGLAKDVEDTYDSVDVLPEWMQRKIATLMIFDPEKVNDEIKGLGRRISKGTFWLYPIEGEDDGNDA